MKQFTISPNESGQRFDKYLKKLLSNASGSFVYKMLRKKNITLNDRKADGTEKLNAGDLVKLFLSDETFEKFSGKDETNSGYMKLKSIDSGRLQVVYEDDDVIIINKPSGMLSQKAVPEDISANEYILSYLIRKGALSEEQFKTFKPSICNRLDRNTSGLLIAGKTLKGLQTMAEALKKRTVQKYYRCIVKGELREKTHLKGYLSKDEQKKALRRLYLRWHPDKNPDQEELANEAFKYIKNKYEEFKQNGEEHGQSSSSKNYRGQNKSGQSSWSWNFKDFYDEWDSEATRHRQGRERSYRHNSRPHYNFSSFHQEMPRPDKAEAKRWYLQAQCDLDAAHNDTGGESPEWCLFKVHQAVEKALMAAEYRRCGKSSPNCSISSLAQKVSGYCPELSALPGLVSRLKHLGVNAKTTQYPSYHTPPKIPNNTFQPENEKEVLDIASELLQKVDTFITN